MAALWNRAGHYIFILWFLSNICLLFTARRNARIASAVLATAIPSIRPSVCLSHAGIVSCLLYTSPSPRD